MFRKTETKQLDMFTEPSMLMGERESKKYLDSTSWHNRFYSMVTSKIDEEIFRPLFKNGKMGAPNASIRVLVGMSILKEGFGCSDEDLFEKCEFDLLTRKALGLPMLNDVMPSLDTYYLFRRRLCSYEADKGIDLMSKCFEQVTGAQVALLKISGKAVRMDSKLIGSNIAHCSRYELVVLTLAKFLCHESNILLLTEEERKKAEEYKKENPQKTVYHSDAETLANGLLTVGKYIYGILSHVDKTAEDFALLQRVFNDQYIVEPSICQEEEMVVTLRNKESISANSLQSPYDTDAAFRTKGNQHVVGYSTNITETVEDNKPSIITSVQVEPATEADCHYVQEAIENSERVTGDKVKDVYSDGAYQSPENREWAKSHDEMRLNICKMQGGNKWELIPHDDEGLTVQNIKTGQTYEATKVVNKKGKRARWRIPLISEEGKTKWRYFDEKEIKAYLFRKEIESLPPEEQHKRNNIEAAMFQYSFHTRNNKTRYRGLLKHRMQAYSRCMWMNLRRIVIYTILTVKELFLAILKPIQTNLRHFQTMLEKFCMIIRDYRSTTIYSLNNWMLAKNATY